MFQKITENDEEKSFSDAYRSEILDNSHNNKEEGTLFKKLMFTLLLVILISTMSIWGYKHFSNTPLNDTTNKVEDSKLKTDNNKAIEEQKIEEQKIEESVVEEFLPTESMMIDNIKDLEIIEPAKTSTMEPTPTAVKSDIDNIADKMKLELSKELDKESSTSIVKNTPSIEEKRVESISPIPQIQKDEELYMKQLAELSKEIDGEIK